MSQRLHYNKQMKFMNLQDTTRRSTRVAENAFFVLVKTSTNKIASNTKPNLH